jgi:hypothetical protein
LVKNTKSHRADLVILHKVCLYHASTEGFSAMKLARLNTQRRGMLRLSLALMVRLHKRVLVLLPDRPEAGRQKAVLPRAQPQGSLFDRDPPHTGPHSEVSGAQCELRTHESVCFMKNSYIF